VTRYSSSLQNQGRPGPSKSLGDSFGKSDTFGDLTSPRNSSQNKAGEVLDLGQFPNSVLNCMIVRFNCLKTIFMIEIVNV